MLRRLQQAGFTGIFGVFVMAFLLIGLSGAATLAADAPLPKGLTDAERQLIQQDYAGYLRNRYESQRSLQRGMSDALSVFDRKPVQPVVAPAEHEPADIVCFSWTGYTALLSELIRDVSKYTKCLVAVSSFSLETARRRLQSEGANMDNVIMLPTRLDSVWMRDYGPHTIYTGDGQREILNLIYNRPRPNDNRFPITVGEHLSLQVHHPRLILPGGNLILDGHGVAIMTENVFDPNHGGDANMTVEELEKLMYDYFGAHKVILLPQMNQDGTGHVDMFCKLLNDRDVIIGEYASPSDGAAGNYEILNRAAAILEAETNGKGEPFRVHRIPMPPYRFRVTRTYTNSLIVNNQVLVPVYGHTETEQIALDLYQSLMPEHEIIPYDCNSIINANGAIHCITKMVMMDPIAISLLEEPHITERGALVQAAIISSRGLRADEKPVLFWQAEGDYVWASVKMEELPDNPDYFEALLPPQPDGTSINFFIQAEDQYDLVRTYPNRAPEAGYLTISF